MRVFASQMRQGNPQLMAAHFRLLGMLHHRSHTLSELADIQSVSLPTMSNTITTLEERGWVRRIRSKEDRRVVLIEVTEAGQEILQETHRRAEGYIAQLLGPLTEEEDAALSEGLSILHRIFRCQYPPPKEDTK